MLVKCPKYRATLSVTKELLRQIEWRDSAKVMVQTRVFFALHALALAAAVIKADHADVAEPGRLRYCQLATG